MANKTEYVTIPLQEYKELLLKETQALDSDNVNFERVLNYIEERLVYSKEDKWNSSYLGNNLKYKDDDENLVKEIITMLKYTNFDRYMKIWNNVQTKHRKEEELKMKMEQMNNAKEIRQENKKEKENE